MQTAETMPCRFDHSAACFGRFGVKTELQIKIKRTYRNAGGEIGLESRVIACSMLPLAPLFFGVNTRI